MEVLVELGAVETRSDSDSGQVYGLTSLGVYLAQLPVEPRTGKMLVYGAVLGCVRRGEGRAAGLLHPPWLARPSAPSCLL